jgi:hypothetical protein
VPHTAPRALALVSGDGRPHVGIKATWGGRQRLTVTDSGTDTTVGDDLRDDTDLLALEPRRRRCTCGQHDPTA